MATHSSGLENPGKSHGQRSLVSYSPWGHKELDMAERLSTHQHKTSIEHLAKGLWKGDFISRVCRTQDRKRLTVILLARKGAYRTRNLTVSLGFPGGSAGKESTCSVGDLGWIPGLGRSPGEGNSYLVQYSGLENSMEYSMGSQRVGHD